MSTDNEADVRPGDARGVDVPGEYQGAARSPATRSPKPTTTTTTVVGRATVTTVTTTTTTVTGPDGDDDPSDGSESTTRIGT